MVEVVVAGALLSTAALVALGPIPTVDEIWAAIFFGAFGLFASGLGYKTSSDTTGTIGFLPFLSVAMIAPGWAAVASVAIAVLGGELIVRRQPLKAVFNVAQQSLAQALAVCCYLLLGGTSMLNSAPSISAFAVMVLVFMLVNKLAVSTVVSEASGRSVNAHWLHSIRGSVVYDLLAFPAILFFAFAYREFGPGWSATLALPMLMLRQLYKHNFALQKNNEEFLQLMVASIEARDPYTSGHSQRVARYARVIARAAGISGKAADRVVVAALLHDVGKIYEEFAPILRKPGRLTDAEFGIMKSHSARGAALVGKVSQFADLVTIIRSHHEAWDGRGYPDGLAGDEIPLGARVIALADTIDAMSTSRPYRESMSADVVHEEIVREAGRQFDPRICRALVSAEIWDELRREIVLATSEYPVFAIPDPRSALDGPRAARKAE